MFSINIKRSVVTVGVVAGLLGAAGPASAQGGGADFTRFASPGPHVGISIGTTEVFELNTFGSLDPVEHRGGNDTQLAAGCARGLKPDSNEVAVEGLAVIYDVPPAVVADAGRGDDTITQTREPLTTVTMLDYMGSP